MKVPRSVSARVLIVAGVAAIIGFACAAGMVRVLTLRTRTAVAEALHRATTQPGFAACEQAPASFALSLPDGVRAFAYDSTARISANPGAPSLELPVDRLPSATGEVRTIGRGALRGMAIVLRARARGPCTFLAVWWPPRYRESDPLLVSAAVMALATAAMTAVGFLLVVKPLLQRLESLRLAAEAVGNAEYPAPGVSGDLDELMRIRAALDRAHSRILDGNARLSGRLRALQEHLTNIAHDLRTPLASLQAQVEEALDAESAVEVRTSLQGALRECVYVTGLAENLRLASQLQEGWDPGGTGEIDLSSTVARVVERLAHYARRREISIQYAVPETRVSVRCDPFACEQALGNLIENAITHLSPRGRIGVVLDALVDHGFVLTIIDDGPGVALVELSRLGERTFRSDEARARDPRGSGLGLAIAKTVCERCGWSLEFSRAEEGGLCVEIRGRRTEASRSSKE